MPRSIFFQFELIYACHRHGLSLESLFYMRKDEQVTLSYYKKEHTENPYWKSKSMNVWFLLYLSFAYQQFILTDTHPLNTWDYVYVTINVSSIKVLEVYLIICAISLDNPDYKKCLVNSTNLQEPVHTVWWNESCTRNIAASYLQFYPRGKADKDAPSSFYILTATHPARSATVEFDEKRLISASSSRECWV